LKFVHEKPESHEESQLVICINLRPFGNGLEPAFNIFVG
jgi:hypothetical protein